MVRTQIHTLANKVIERYRPGLFVLLDINSRQKITPIIIILAYSAIKIIAKPSLPYSTLNPDTSSDSPSAKSKGVRFVSAKQEISQIPTIGRNINALYQKIFNFANKYIFSLAHIIR